MTKDEISEWVKSSLQEAGISYAEASRRLGIPSGGISKVVAQDRDLSAQEMFALAKIAGTKVPWAAYALVPQVRYIIVRGEVGAGLWRDVTQTDFQDYEISAIIDPKYDDDAVFAFRISGESVNKIAGDGDHLVALKYDRAPRTLQSGDWVIAEASRGDLKERTVKRVKAADDGSWVLCPYSNDPRYQEPMVIGENGEDRVEVIAYVLDFLRKGTRF